ncbi:MAG TPA: phospho-sugar mutase [Flavobacteriales bacterium]|jgi:phosphoglucomutase
MESTLFSEALAKANKWLTSSVVDDDTKAEIEHLIDNDTKAFEEAFYSDLEFGTGGLRGVMGVGTMRINEYTIGMATQGLSNYILKQVGISNPSVAIAYDSRNNSKFFAETAAAVLSANGIKVYIYEDLRPTPMLSFAVRTLGCIAGIVITASHNPKEYNGYKVYWQDGAQVLPPHDKGIIAEVRNVQRIDDVKFEKNEKLIQHIDKKVEDEYLKNLLSIIHHRPSSDNDIKIVYTSLHGAGITMVPRALHAVGFNDVHIVEAQAIADGDFPTVQSPNPEEREALTQALELGDKIGADLILGTDPDTDRVGAAVRNNDGKLVLLNGNQAACLIVYYQLLQVKSKGLLDGKKYIAKTIVTTELLTEIAKGFGVKQYETLTGFKYIAGVIREKEGKETFVAGGEESYGYSVGEFVRDKDAILSSVVLAEIASWCKSNNSSLWNLLMDIYAQFGLYHEALVSITMKGLDGLQQINNMMVRLRNNPPQSLGGSPVIALHDVNDGTITNVKTGEKSTLDLPKSNVLQFLLEDGSKVSARPSGTEPKIKFYFSLKAPFNGKEHYVQQVQEMEAKIATIRKELGV